ncbi:MAG: peptidoglycan editing factor PgeF [Methylovulum sp.]|jgi:YfiH family protein|nr:peptidoglycan editing factor PgeF [Methylovulum sp.]
MKNKLCLRPDWPLPAGVHSATTLRLGGVSSSPYSALNLATHVDDDVKAVLQNRQRIKAHLMLPSEPLWLQQVHGNDVYLGTEWLDSPLADAIVTAQKNRVCAVLTADCLPILVCTHSGEKIAAIHAGWRGLLKGIITNTIAAMHTTNCMVWLGPAISVKHFEVGAEVRDAFIQKDAAFASAFTEKKQQKWLADIYAIAKVELQALGIFDIYGGDLCTFADAERFYSYRRDGQTGRMASLIWKT